MCDFRSPPTGLVEEDGSIRPVKFRGSATWCKELISDGNGVLGKIMDANAVEEEGVYYVCATGSSYRYHNGNAWDSSKELLFEEGDDWTCGSHRLLSDLTIKEDF
jgi:hypothetical protein